MALTISVFPIAVLSQYFFGIVLFFLSVFLILLILVQQGRGGGLTGALGGAGGQSAFGTKAGDVFTRITIIVASIWIVMSALAVFLFNEPGVASALTNTTVNNASPINFSEPPPAMGAAPSMGGIMPATGEPSGTPVVPPSGTVVPPATEGQPVTPAPTTSAPATTTPEGTQTPAAATAAAETKPTETNPPSETKPAEATQTPASETTQPTTAETPAAPAQP